MTALDPYILAGLSWALILGGSFFYVTGAIGLTRMPDVFTRMHATSVSETMGASMLILGMMLQSGFNLNTGRLAVILVVLLFTGPMITHALARAAQFAGLKPELANDRTRPARRKPAAKRSPAAREPAKAAKRSAARTRRSGTKSRGGQSSKR